MGRSQLVSAMFVLRCDDIIKMRQGIGRFQLCFTGFHGIGHWTKEQEAHKQQATQATRKKRQPKEGLLALESSPAGL
jgi:hypothetical protein